MKTATIKKQIKKKFGTISKFAELTGIDRYELQKKFAREDLDDADARILSGLAISVKIVPTDGEIHPEKLERLKTALNAFGGVLKFTEENQGFSRDSVNQILAGRRKRISPVVQQLFDFFKIE